jgi:hypothetical protein
MMRCFKHNREFCCECRYGKIAESHYPLNDTITDIKKSVRVKIKDYLYNHIQEKYMDSLT